MPSVKVKSTSPSGVTALILFGGFDVPVVSLTPRLVYSPEWEGGRAWRRNTGLMLRRLRH